MLTLYSQTGSNSILKQLLDKKAIQRPIFSLMLINGHEGVLSIGGTAASAIEMVVSQMKLELDHIGMIEQGGLPADTPAAIAKPLTKRGRVTKDVIPRQADWQEGWAWNKVQGAEGWWQILMQAVYVDGAKVLQNQAVVLDVCDHPALLSWSRMTLTCHTDQQPLYPCSTPRSQSLLRLCLGLLAAPAPSLEFLRLPLPQSPSPAFRIRRYQVPIHARRSRRRLDWSTRR